MMIKEKTKEWIDGGREGKIDNYIDLAIFQYPSAFHDESTLRDRIFFDEPRPGTRHAVFVKKAPKNHIWI